MPINELTPEILKQILQQEAGSGRPRIVAAVLATTLMVVILEIIRRRKLREEFSPIWISWALGVIVAAVFYTPLVRLTQALGAWTLSSTVFLVAIVFLTAAMLHLSIQVSTLWSRCTRLAQEVALLNERIGKSTAGDRDEDAGR